MTTATTTLTYRAAYADGDCVSSVPFGTDYKAALAAIRAWNADGHHAWITNNWGGVEADLPKRVI